MRKKLYRVVFSVLVFSFHMMVAASASDSISEIVSEMKEMGASVRCGTSKDGDVFFVGIGRSKYRPGAINRCREIARINAVKELTSALQMSFKAHDVSRITMRQDGDNAAVKAFFSSVSEASIDQLLKGVQVIATGKNGDGEMEVVVCATSKMKDKSNDFIAAQLQWGDKGVVKAVGIDTDRAVAEKNALRSAVEQVAGTLVVGKVSVNEREEMHKRLAVTAGALVEEYQVVKETKVEMEYQVEVIARVNKRKLYDNYRSYFKSLDDPSFCIVATDESLVSNFTGYFIGKGFAITKNQTECDYLIKLNGNFRDRPTPGNSSSTGTMLNLNIEVVSADGRRTLLSMNEKQSKDSEVLSSIQRRDEVSRRIFNKLESRLHQAIHDMVVRMLDDADAMPEPKMSTGTEL